MARALPKPPRMPRAERMRLQRERQASAKRREVQRLHRVLREQSELLRECRARIANCIELRELVRAARASAQRSVKFGGAVFSVRRNAVFSEVYTATGRHLASFPGDIFDV